MAVTGAGRKPNHDWPLLKAEFEARYVPEGRTLREFSEDRELDETVVSNAFRRLAKQSAMAAFHDRDKPLLLVAQRGVMNMLAEAMNKDRKGYDPVEVGRFALLVLEKVAEREEPNPGLSASLNVVMPPLFPQGSLAAQAIEALTGVSKEDRLKALGPRSVRGKRTK